MHASRCDFPRDGVGPALRVILSKLSGELFGVLAQARIDLAHLAFFHLIVRVKQHIEHDTVRSTAPDLAASLFLLRVHAPPLTARLALDRESRRGEEGPDTARAPGLS